MLQPLHVLKHLLGVALGLHVGEYFCHLPVGADDDR